MNGYLNQLHDEYVVFNKRNTARFEWVAGKKKYRTVYIRNKDCSPRAIGITRDRDRSMARSRIENRKSVIGAISHPGSIGEIGTQ
jgi:hypothetical protein